MRATENLPRLGRAAWMVLFVLGTGRAAIAITELRRGQASPPLELNTLSGERFSLQGQRGRAIVLIFGELYHERSLKAISKTQELLRDPRFEGKAPSCAMVMTQQSEPAALLESARKNRVTVAILHDRDRRAFAAYQVSVIPSVVVIDAESRVVHAFAGMSAAFDDMLRDSMLLAAGRISEATFERTLHPTSAPAATEPVRRAARLTELAHQLVRSGMEDLAHDKYREALTVDPGCAAARVGLGRIAVHRQRLAEAEEHFRAAAKLDAGSADVALGLAYVQALRGGDELPKAEESIRGLLATQPNNAEAHFLLGVVFEQSGRMKEAAGSYRKSAELLLRQEAAASGGGK